jgi:hypothetical protein
VLLLPAGSMCWPPATDPPLRLLLCTPLGSVRYRAASSTEGEGVRASSTPRMPHHTQLLYSRGWARPRQDNRRVAPTTRPPAFCVQGRAVCEFQSLLRNLQIS